jgi:hypothetical protein
MLRPKEEARIPVFIFKKKCSFSQEDDREERKSEKRPLVLKPLSMFSVATFFFSKFSCFSVHFVSSFDISHFLHHVLLSFCCLLPFYWKRNALSEQESPKTRSILSFNETRKRGKQVISCLNFCLKNQERLFSTKMKEKSRVKEHVRLGWKRSRVRFHTKRPEVVVVEETHQQNHCSSWIRKTRISFQSPWDSNKWSRTENQKVASAH